MNYLFDGIAVLFIVNGLVHWFYVFGVRKEDLSAVPNNIAKFLLNYSRLLAFLDLAAGAGILMRTSWGLWLAIAIAVSQLPTHGAVVYYKKRAGLIPERFRYFDMILAVIFLAFCCLPAVRDYYFI
jgi:uncharacterized membrane protein YjjP (DUF1212 family)